MCFGFPKFREKKCPPFNFYRRYRVLLGKHQEVKVHSMQEFTNNLHSDDHRDAIDDNNLLNLIGTVRMMGVVELNIYFTPSHFFVDGTKLTKIGFH